MQDKRNLLLLLLLLLNYNGYWSYKKLRCMICYGIADKLILRLLQSIGFVCSQIVFWKAKVFQKTQKQLLTCLSVLKEQVTDLQKLHCGWCAVKL